METDAQPPLALLIPELRKMILSFCLDTASAYYVCIDWFHTLDELLAADETKKRYAYARLTAAALRLGFKLRDWQGYRFLMRAKGHRLITNAGSWRAISDWHGDFTLSDLVGDPGGVNGRSTESDLSVNDCLYVFHNVVHEGAVFVKKVKVLEISLDLTTRAAIEYEVEDPKEFAAIDTEAVLNGIHSQELPPGALMNGVAIEPPMHPAVGSVVDTAASLEDALAVAKDQGRVGEMPWVAAVAADLEAAPQIQNLDPMGALPLVTPEEYWQAYADLPKPGWLDDQRPPETFRDGLAVEMNDGDRFFARWWKEGEEEEDLQLPKDARSRADDWFEARSQVARSCRKHVAVESGCDAAAAGDLKEMLKNMCLFDFFDTDEEFDLVWGAADRVKIEREFRSEPRPCKMEYVGPRQPGPRNVE